MRRRVADDAGSVVRLVVQVGRDRVPVHDRALLVDRVDRLVDRVRPQARAVVELLEAVVLELAPLVRLVDSQRLVRTGAAGLALAHHGRRAELAVDDPHRGVRDVTVDDVVAPGPLGVQPERDPVDERLGVVGVGDVVEHHDAQLAGRVRVRLAGGRAVVRDLRAVGVGLDLVERHGHRAHADRPHVRGGLEDRVDHRLRVVLEEPDVEDVLEDPRPPRGRGVERRVVVVADRDRDVGVGQSGGLAVEQPGLDLQVALLEQLPDAAVEQVIGEVEVVGDHGNAVAVRPSTTRARALTRVPSVSAGTLRVACRCGS